MSLARGLLISVIWVCVLAVILVTLWLGANLGRVVINFLAVGATIYLTQFIGKTKQTEGEQTTPLKV